MHYAHSLLKIMFNLPRDWCYMPPCLTLERVDVAVSPCVDQRPKGADVYITVEPIVAFNISPSMRLTFCGYKDLRNRLSRAVNMRMIQ
jgi:hypothetical protein